MTEVAYPVLVGAMGPVEEALKSALLHSCGTRSPPVGTGQPLATISRQVNVNKLPELTPAKKYFFAFEITNKVSRRI